MLIPVDIFIPRSKMIIEDTMKSRKRIIIDVSEKFHSNVKIQATQEKRSIKELVIEALCSYLTTKDGRK